jgi:hypothetical protein
MKSKKRLLYSVTISLSIIAWLTLSGALVFSFPKQTTNEPPISENPDPICAGQGKEYFQTTHYGLPMDSYEYTSYACLGDERLYFPIGIAADVATALAITGIPAVLILRHLRKKYAIIAST